MLFGFNAFKGFSSILSKDLEEQKNFDCNTDEVKLIIEIDFVPDFDFSTNCAVLVVCWRKS